VIAPGTKGRLAALLATVAVGGVAAATAAGAGHPAKSAFSGVSPSVSRQLLRTKAALAKYRNVKRAKADGYAPASPCEAKTADKEASSDGGGMGIHYVSNAAMADGKLIPTRPEILVYAPTAKGPQLVTTEYFQPGADQKTSTDGDRPALFGRAFDGPMLGHAPGMPVHYDLHVWLFTHKPSGTFAPWNPNVRCR